MENILQIIKNTRQTLPCLTILKAIRTKIEYSRRYKYRLGGMFQGLKSTLLVGQPGTGKTTMMRSIYSFLTKKENSNVIWVDGSATTAGRREKLKENPNAIIFWDEISCVDLQDVRLLKQITDGKISHIKWGDLEEVKFNGIIIGSSNEFITKGKTGRELDSLRDRLDIIEVGPPEGYTHEAAIDISGKSNDIDWGIIFEKLKTHNQDSLTNNEFYAVKDLWKIKIVECLDDRVLNRAASEYLDCFVFCKRFFGTLEDKEVWEVAKNFANTLVNLNASILSNLPVLQKDIVNLISSKKEKSLSFSDIKNALIDKGKFTNSRAVYNAINKLIEADIIIKNNNLYSIIKIKNNTEI